LTLRTGRNNRYYAKFKLKFYHNYFQIISTDNSGKDWYVTNRSDTLLKPYMNRTSGKYRITLSPHDPDIHEETLAWWKHNGCDQYVPTNDIPAIGSDNNEESKDRHLQVLYDDFVKMVAPMINMTAEEVDREYGEDIKENPEELIEKYAHLISPEQ